MYSGDKATGPDSGPEARDDAGLLLPQLQQALAAARDAAAAQQALDDSPEAIGQAARKAAHEFNNLLTVVGSSVELLRHPGLPPERRERYLTAIETTTERAALMTRSIQALARRLAPRKAVIDVAARMGAVMRQARVAPATPSPGPLPVLIDPADFDDAVLCLAEAGHGGDDDGVRLTITLSATPGADGHPQVSIRLSPVSEATTAQVLLFASRMLDPLRSPGALPDEWRTLFWFAARYDGDVVAELQGDRLALTLRLPLHRP